MTLKVSGDRARVPLGHGHVADRHRRQRIVVSDRPESLRVEDRRVQSVGQVEEEAFVVLVERVPVDEDGDGFRGVAGGEAERAASRLVVGAGRRGVVRRRVVDGDGLAADRESETMKVAATVPLFPSVTVTLFTDSDGSGSSSVIVPTPRPSTIVRPWGFERVIVNVSVPSSRASSVIGTATCATASGPPKATVPLTMP